MNKSIHTLVADIYDQLNHTKEGWFTDDLSGFLAGDIAGRLSNSLGGSQQKARLRLSQMGPRCPRALWHMVNTPHLAEQLPAWAKIKYSFGHVIEALAITLAKAAGHEVTGEQDELVVDDVKGHRDCVIDGCIVDVKSTSSFGFKKFETGSIREDDAFGYLDQLDAYLVGSSDDPLVRSKDKAYLLAIDKQLGHMCLYEHRLRRDQLIKRVDEYKRIVAQPNPPKCTCGTQPDRKSGNERLDVKASYNSFKHQCFPHLRTFLYASGPVYLTKVVRKPDVTEVDRYGNVVYN